jgi:DNA-binding NarL/FixJ family response regulator
VLRTAAGDTVVSGSSTAQLIRRAVATESEQVRRAAAKRVAVLTARERAVATGVARGEPKQGVGAALHISAGTVKSHLEQVFVKLGVRSRVQVGMIFERAGFGPAEI